MTRPEQRQEAHRDPGEPSRQPGMPPQRGGRIALLLGLPGLLLSVTMLPVGLVLDLGAVIIGVRALRQAGREHVKAPGAIPGVIFGSIGLLLVALVFALFLVFRTEVSTYLDCMSGANTITARENCQTELKESLEDRFGLTDLGTMSAFATPPKAM